MYSVIDKGTDTHQGREGGVIISVSQLEAGEVHEAWSVASVGAPCSPCNVLSL